MGPGRPPPPVRARARLVAALALGLLGACAYRPGHPVLRGPWGVGPPRPLAAATPAFVGSGDPALLERAPATRLDAFFADLPQIRLRLREMRQRATGPGQPIAQHSDRVAAAGLVRRLGGRGPLGGALRNACVFGLSGHLPRTPRQAADLWLHPVAQGKALGIQAFEREGVVFELPEAVRLHYRVAMLGVGTSPLTFDLVFGTSIEALELGDGSVALRYDARPTRGQKHVTLWRGGALFEPHAGGTMVTEVVVFGTDIVVPLLESVLRSQVEAALRARGINLCGFAYQQAGLPVPGVR